MVELTSELMVVVELTSEPIVVVELMVERYLYSF